MPQSSEEVNIPFQLFVPPGDSTFSLSVPRHFDSVYHGGEITPKRRKFHFSQLVITPAYYSQKAAQLDLDSKGELNAPVDFTVTGNFTARPGLYRNPVNDEELRWEDPGGAVDYVMKNFNQYFEITSKPEGLKGAPCFFDWIDINWDLPSDLMYYQEGIDFLELIREREIDYYGLEEGDRFNALEESARSIWNVNNYEFPYNALGDEVFLSQFRLRLQIAPNTSISFSSNGFLTNFGFSNAQIGNRGRLRRFYIENTSTSEYLVICAEGPPLQANLPKTGDKVNALAIARNWVSSPVTTTMTLGNFRKNEELLRELELVIEAISSDNNIDMGVQFNAQSKKFEFTFPDNAHLGVTLKVSKELASRLGFGSGVTKIDRNSKSEAIKDPSSTESVENLAKTLVYDTGMVMVSHNSLSSMSTLGMSEFFMGCLWPTVDGTLALKRTADAPPTINLPNAGAFFANVEFNIWVYNDDGTTRRLEWPTGLYIAGIFQGKLI